MKQSGKRWWLLVTISMVLTVGVALGIFFFLTPDSTTSLKPGGLIRGVDGVSVAAPPGALEHRIDIFIEQVEDPRLEVPFPDFLEGLEVVGNFYEITGSEEYWSEETDLIIGLPVPEGVSPDKLAMVTLSPPWAIIGADAYADPSLRWDFLFGEYDPKNNLFLETLPYVGLSSQVFALIEWEDPSLEEEYYSSFIASNVPIAFGSPPSKQLFSVRCAGRWKVDRDEGLGPCRRAHREATEAALQNAYEAYTSLGFLEPRLKKKNNSFKYQLRQGNHGGFYNNVTKNAYTQYPGSPETPLCYITHHELFHAVQYAYPEVKAKRRSFGVIEGTATTAERSLDASLTRSWSTSVLAIGSPLFAESAGSTGLGSATPVCYQHQDFWVYVGKRINPSDPKLDFLIPLFEKGVSKEHVRDFFREDSTFESLEDAYWQWAKNHAFEKQVYLNDISAVYTTPNGIVGSWSGHGTPRITRYCLAESNWGRYSTGVEINIFGESVEIWPAGWFDLGEYLSFTFSDRFVSRVFEITMNPKREEDHYEHYEAILTVERLTHNLEWLPISSGHAYTRYKFYNIPCTDINYCWNVDRENNPHIVRVYDAPVKVYLLVSNMSGSRSFRVKVESSILHPPKKLTVLSTGISEAIVSAFILHEDGSAGVYADQLTDYTIEDIKHNTRVILSAFDDLTGGAYVPEEDVRVVFSHWSGAVESTAKSVDFIIDEDSTVTAHYSVIEPEPEPVAPLPRPEVEGPSIELPDILPVYYNLSVSAISTGKPVVQIEADIASGTGHGGTTRYALTRIRSGTQVRLSAPEYVGSGESRYRFSTWTGAVTTSSRTITLEMDSDKTARAAYMPAPETPPETVEGPPRYTLTVNSKGDDQAGVDITSNTGHKGKTNYRIPNIASQAKIHLEAPEYLGSGAERKRFSSWSGAVSSSNRIITLEMDNNKTVTANYIDAPGPIARPSPSTFTLTVTSSVDDPSMKIGAYITSKTGHGGTTPYTITNIEEGTKVHLEAPAGVGIGTNFTAWSGDISDKNRSITFTLDSDKAVRANYWWDLY